MTPHNDPSRRGYWPPTQPQEEIPTPMIPNTYPALVSVAVAPLVFAV